MQAFAHHYSNVSVLTVQDEAETTYVVIDGPQSLASALNKRGMSQKDVVSENDEPGDLDVAVFIENTRQPVKDERGQHAGGVTDRAKILLADLPRNPELEKLSAQELFDKATEAGIDMNKAANAETLADLDKILEDANTKSDLPTEDELKQEADQADADGAAGDATKPDGEGNDSEGPDTPPTPPAPADAEGSSEDSTGTSPAPDASDETPPAPSAELTESTGGDASPSTDEGASDAPPAPGPNEGPETYEEKNGEGVVVPSTPESTAKSTKKSSKKGS